MNQTKFELVKPQKSFAAGRACVSSRQQSWRAVRTKEKNLPAHPHWPWPVFSSHPRSVVHHANLTYPANLSPAPSCLMTPCSITPPPRHLPPPQPHSGFSSASTFPLFPATYSLHIHLNSLSHSLAKAHVVFYLILRAFHFGCRRGKSISNMSILAVWSVAHSSVNVFYVTNPVFL